MNQEAILKLLSSAFKSFADGELTLDELYESVGALLNLTYTLGQKDLAEILASAGNPGGTD